MFRSKVKTYRPPQTIYFHQYPIPKTKVQYLKAMKPLSKYQISGKGQLNLKWTNQSSLEQLVFLYLLNVHDPKQRCMLISRLFIFPYVTSLATLNPRHISGLATMVVDPRTLAEVSFISKAASVVEEELEGRRHGAKP